MFKFMTFGLFNNDDQMKNWRTATGYRSVCPGCGKRSVCLFRVFRACRAFRGSAL